MDVASALSRVCSPLLGQARWDRWIPEVRPAGQRCRPAASLPSVSKYFNILATDAAASAWELIIQSQKNIQEVIRKEKAYIWVILEVSKREEELVIRFFLGKR